jgi:hypothetical protein
VEKTLEEMSEDMWMIFRTEDEETKLDYRRALKRSSNLTCDELFEALEYCGGN